MQVHAHRSDRMDRGFQMNLNKRLSTDAEEVATCLNLQAEPNVELADIFKRARGEDDRRN